MDEEPPGQEEGAEEGYVFFDRKIRQRLAAIEEKLEDIKVALDALQVSTAAARQAVDDAAARQAAADTTTQAALADLNNQVATLTADRADPAVVAAIQADVDEIAAKAATIAPAPAPALGP